VQSRHIQRSCHQQRSSPPAEKRRERGFRPAPRGESRQGLAFLGGPEEARGPRRSAIGPPPTASGRAARIGDERRGRRDIVQSRRAHGAISPRIADGIFRSGSRLARIDTSLPRRRRVARAARHGPHRRRRSDGCDRSDRHSGAAARTRASAEERRAGGRSSSPVAADGGRPRRGHRRRRLRLRRHPVGQYRPGEAQHVASGDRPGPGHVPAAHDRARTADDHRHHSYAGHDGGADHAGPATDGAVTDDTSKERRPAPDSDHLAARHRRTVRALLRAPAGRHHRRLHQRATSRHPDRRRRRVHPCPTLTATATGGRLPVGRRWEVLVVAEQVLGVPLRLSEPAGGRNARGRRRSPPG